ncbi:PIN domain-containing protein [Halocola ammonii]
MKVVVDSNIVFSAILNTNSKVGHLLINGASYFDFFTIKLLEDEVYKHKAKIQEISGFSERQFERTYKLITSKITFLDEGILSEKEISETIEIVSEIDENDTLFVALANHLACPLWTGDLKLIKGLKRKSYSKPIKTSEFNEIFLNKVTRY